MAFSTRFMKHLPDTRQKREVMMQWPSFVVVGRKFHCKLRRGEVSIPYVAYAEGSYSWECQQKKSP